MSSNNSGRFSRSANSRQTKKLVPPRHNTPATKILSLFGGMVVATLVGVLLVPAMYVIVERYIARKPEPTPGLPSGTDDVPEPAPAGGR